MPPVNSKNLDTLEVSAAPNLAETIVANARKPIELVDSGTARLFAVPEGYELRTDEALQKLALAPARKSGSVTLRTPASFIQYANQHKQAQSQLYVQIDPASASAPMTITAVFNDHVPGDLLNAAGWKDFRAVFIPQASPEWKTWMGANGRQMSQIEFATFIEDNIAQIAGTDGTTGEKFPAGGDMLQMALSFEASSDKRIKSAVRLQSGGIQMEYVDSDDSATVSRMQAFERFRIGIAPFWKGNAYSLEAKLRYRQAEGKLKLWYELIRPDLVIDHAVEELLATIATEVGITPLMGSVGKSAE